MSRSWLFPWQRDIVQDDGPHPHVYTTRERPGCPALCFDGRDNADSPVRGASRTARSLVTSPAARLTLNTAARAPQAGRPRQDGRARRNGAGGGWWSSGRQAPRRPCQGSPGRKGLDAHVKELPVQSKQAGGAALSALQWVSGEHPSRGMSPALV